NANTTHLRLPTIPPLVVELLHQPQQVRRVAPFRRADLPPNRRVEVLDLLDRLRVDAGGEVLPAVVGDDEDDVAALELAGDAVGDRGDRTGGDAGEDALLVEQLLRPDDRVAVGDHDLAVEQ